MRRDTGEARHSASPRTRRNPSTSLGSGAPRKRFGQHFLEAAWVAKLIESLDARPRDTFLEIGPGRGALTKPLAARVARLIGVEIDRDLASRLAADVPGNVHIVAGDFLDVDLDQVLSDTALPVRVVGNLPYNVSSPILFKLLNAQNAGRRFSDATVMLQKEVADRLTAAPGTGEYGALAIQVSLHADVRRVLTLPPGAFRPPPKVTSAVVRLRFRPPVVDVGNQRVFEQMVRGIFLQRRKMLVNALTSVAAARGHSASQVLQRTGIDGRRRPETLTLEEISQLTRAVL